MPNVNELIIAKLHNLNRSLDELMDNIDPNTKEVEVEYVQDLITATKDLQGYIVYRIEYYVTNNIPVQKDDVEILDYINETLSYLNAI